MKNALLQWGSHEEIVMPACHRFKNFQPRGLELRQLRFEQTQCRLHPQWHQIELHHKIPQDMGGKNQFSPFPPWCSKTIKTPFFCRIGRSARSTSLKRTHIRTDALCQPSFPKGGKSTTAHLQQNNSKTFQRTPRCPQLQTSERSAVEQRSARGQSTGPGLGMVLRFIDRAAEMNLRNLLGTGCTVTHFSREHPRQLPFSGMCHFLCSWNNTWSQRISVNLCICVRCDLERRKTRNQHKAFCWKLWETTALK